MFIEPRNVVLRDLLSIIDPSQLVYLTIEYDDGEIAEYDPVYWSDIKLSDDLVESIRPRNEHSIEIVVYHEYIY